ncbi:hypothetical protein KR222_003239 [Zaprionus bogoriensis]|nr:hypothetical protein KR222_003239 [Zaprionus bogoriensis]
MLAFSSKTRINIFVQLLLLLWPLPLVTQPMASESGTLGAFDIDKVIETIHKERHVETVLIITRPQDPVCRLKNFNSPKLPTLRHDKSTVIHLKKVYNSETLALVCISDIEDSILLTTLAQDLNYMREARIIIWLCGDSTKLLQIIRDQAAVYNFLNLLVLHASFQNDKELVTPYGLRPFPSPTLQRIGNISKGPIFPKVYLNFYGKIAVTIPDSISLSIAISTDLRLKSGLFFSAKDKLIVEFTQRRNIQLRMHRYFNRIIDSQDIMKLTQKGELDLPVRYFLRDLSKTSRNIELIEFVEIGSVFVAVPCAQVISIGDVFKGLRTYFAIVIGAYFIFAILETLFFAATYRIVQERFCTSYSSLIVNLRVFCAVLGLPTQLERYRRSFSLQQIVMVMSIFSLIFTCFFNANLSTLLTKHSDQKQIQNFNELRESGLPVATGKIFKDFVDSQSHNGVDFRIRNIEIFDNDEAQYLAFSLNNSYAHYMYSKMWIFVQSYQKNYKINVLCTSAGLKICDTVYATGIVRNNSVFRESLSEFTQWWHTFGFPKYWEKYNYRKLIAHFHPMITRAFPKIRKGVTPLALQDFIWLWKLLGICYTVVGLVFIAELCADHWQKRRTRRITIIMR